MHTIYRKCGEGQNKRGGDCFKTNYGRGAIHMPIIFDTVYKQVDTAIGTNMERFDEGPIAKFALYANSMHGLGL